MTTGTSTWMNWTTVSASNENMSCSVCSKIRAWSLRVTESPSILTCDGLDRGAAGLTACPDDFVTVLSVGVALRFINRFDP
jgi:hypothetical protein